MGSQTASCNYDDAGGLNAKATATYSIVDTSKPLVTVDAPATTEATGALTPVTFAASAYDAVDGTRPVTCKTAGGTTYASGGSFPVGTTTLTCSATDKAGNTGISDPFNVVVTDTTAPEVTTPANIVVGNDAATVTYANATATDLVDGTVPASCTPASGTKFALGHHHCDLHGDRPGRQHGHQEVHRRRCKTSPSRSSPSPPTRLSRRPDRERRHRHLRCSHR